MPIETSVRLRTSSLEASVAVPLIDAIPANASLCGPGALAAPTATELDAWYGGPDNDKVAYIADYYPVVVIYSGQDTHYAFEGSFGSPWSFNLEVHRQNTGVTSNIREEWIYFEKTTGWNAPNVLRITHSSALSSADDFDFEIRCSTVPATRNAANGKIYDYAGAPHLLMENIAGFATTFPPQRTGALIANRASLPKDAAMTFSYVQGSALAFISVDQSNPGAGEFHAGFVVEVL